MTGGYKRVELRPQAYNYPIVIALTLSCSGLLLWISLLIPKGNTSIFLVLMFGILLMLFTGAVAIWWMRRSRLATAPEGILVNDGTVPFVSQRTIPWKSIAAYEVVQNTEGHQALVLRDKAGKAILLYQFNIGSKEEQAQFREVLGWHCLQQLQKDASSLPGDMNAKPA